MKGAKSISVAEVTLNSLLLARFSASLSLKGPHLYSLIVTPLNIVQQSLYRPDAHLYREGVIQYTVSQALRRVSCHQIYHYAEVAQMLVFV